MERRISPFMVQMIPVGGRHAKKARPFVVRKVAAAVAVDRFSLFSRGGRQLQLLLPCVIIDS